MLEIENLKNEDGTNVLDGFPENPLKEKWSKLYPPYPDTKYDDYGCMECSKCPFGGEWEIPEDDLEIWNEYQNRILEYHKIHNPELYRIVMSEGLNKVKTKKI